MLLALALLLLAFLLPLNVAAADTDPRAEMLTLINGYRAEHGLQPLLPSQHLTEAAQAHAERMTCLTHFDSLERGPFERMGVFGYTGPRRGEVVAMGSDDPQTIFKAWRDSPGHNSVLLDRDFFVAGIGFEDGRWVMDLGGCRSCPKTYPTWGW